jgi:hypothetical protein
MTISHDDRASSLADCEYLLGRFCEHVAEIASDRLIQWARRANTTTTSADVDRVRKVWDVIRHNLEGGGCSTRRECPPWRSGTTLWSRFVLREVDAPVEVECEPGIREYTVYVPAEESGGPVLADARRQLDRVSTLLLRNPHPTSAQVFAAHNVLRYHVRGLNTLRRVLRHEVDKLRDAGRGSSRPRPNAKRVGRRPRPPLRPS